MPIQEPCRFAINAWEAQERFGQSGRRAGIGASVVYLACAPKSNAVYMAYNAAMSDARQSGSLGVAGAFKKCADQADEIAGLR